MIFKDEVSDRDVSASGLTSLDALCERLSRALAESSPLYAAIDPEATSRQPQATLAAIDAQRCWLVLDDTRLLDHEALWTLVQLVARHGRRGRWVVIAREPGRSDLSAWVQVGPLAREQAQALVASWRWRAPMRWRSVSAQIRSLSAQARCERARHCGATRYEAEAALFEVLTQRPVAPEALEHVAAASASPQASRRASASLGCEVALDWLDHRVVEAALAWTGWRTPPVLDASSAASELAWGVMRLSRWCGGL